MYYHKNILLSLSVGLSIFSFYGIYSYYCSFQKKLVQPSAPKEIVLSPEEIYVNSWKEKFTDSFSDSNSDSDFHGRNGNIQPIFYLFDEYKTEVERTENTLEKQWKTRILFENTPRGNLIMYYDAYKHGFAYYSDVFISYAILNACAMKYVLTFYCRDFYIDETGWPEGTNSPFLRVHLLEEKKKGKKEDDKFDVTQGPFAKLKLKSSAPQKNGIPVRKSLPVLSKKAERAESVEKMKNKFIHLGKMANFSFLKGEPVQIKKKNLGIMNYCDFKSWRSPVANGGENHLFGGSSSG